jgi:ABC-type molybdenum transport system ATPase subunit/photorepair protein PhrA
LEVTKNQYWYVLGKNGSGKQYLNQLFTVELTNATAQRCQLPKAAKDTFIVVCSNSIGE